MCALQADRYLRLGRQQIIRPKAVIGRVIAVCGDKRPMISPQLDCDAVTLKMTMICGVAGSRNVKFSKTNNVSGVN